MDPTPEQIRKRCEKIRAKWSEFDRLHRSGQLPTPWTAPQYVVSKHIRCSVPRAARKNRLVKIWTHVG